MRSYRLQSLAIVLAVASILLPFGITGTRAFAQNAVSGEIAGTVTDATGAVVPRANVTLTSVSFGVQSQTQTSTSGLYRFPLLQPGSYEVRATAIGFGTVTRQVTVNLGQVTAANIVLAVSGKVETVEVMAEAELLHSESANLAATVDAEQVALLPNSGGDITNYALTTPGVVLSTGGGYGNFTSNGIGGMSNLYTINGNDYNDPYLNLNNSGSSNMLLGANEVQEATVVTNGYTAQYGRMAGANMNVTTKSGTNQFHGSAKWNWNGALLNANDWYNKPNAFNAFQDTARPHAVSNQWGADIGGRILKNKLFFYYDNEGIRYVLPGGGAVDIPSPAFETAVLANLKNVSPSSVAFYQKAFNVYNGASGYKQATAVTPDIDPALGCGDMYDTTAGTSALPGLAYGTPCALQFQSTVNNLNTERLQSIRVDWNPTNVDKVNFRYKGDRGIQATSTDPINSAFSANSVQPSDEGQMGWTRVLNNAMVNQFMFSDMHYVAKFGPPNFAGAVNVFPTSLAFSDGLFFTLGGDGTGFYGYPSGRVVEQYQFVDDFNWTKGSHDIKFGVNFRRNDISDYSGSSGTTGLVTSASMTSFSNGVIDGGTFAQTFSKAHEVPVALYSIGFYIQDEWRVNPKVKFTLGLRVDRNSNEVCQKDCFARPGVEFMPMDHNVNTAYNASIKSVRTVFPNLESAVWGPRGGVNWTPWGTKTVIRGGVGLFSTLYPGLLGSRAILNLPNVAAYTITEGPVSPDVSGNVFTQASASNTALQSAYASGGTLASIKAALPTFSAPNLTTFATNVVNPKYLKWNVEIERLFGSKTAFSVNYVGNHGYDLFLQNRTLNAYCTTAKCPGGFESLPSAATDARFSNIREYANGGYANYAGVTVTATQNLTKGLAGSLNYTWSHTLDELYEGGIEPLNNLNNPSFMVVIDPFNPKKYNYASADQDVRHLLTANFYYKLPGKSSNAILDQVIGGWVLSGTFQRTTGTPFSAYYTSITSSLLGNASNGRALAQMNTAGTGSCGRPNANSPCFARSQFQYHAGTVPYQMAWGGGYNTRRNSFRGPGYFDSDISLVKEFKITEGVVVSAGAQAINFFNHPNFDRPVGSLSSGSFGKITATVGQPNSPYGNFQGSAANGRIVVSELKVKF